MQPTPSSKADHGTPCTDPEILEAADRLRMALRFYPTPDQDGNGPFKAAAAAVVEFGEFVEATYVGPEAREDGALYTFRWKVDTFSGTTITVLVPTTSPAQVKSTGAISRVPTIMLLGALVQQLSLA